MTDDVDARALAAELQQSLDIVREMIAGFSMSRSEAESWVRMELYIMCSLTYFAKTDTAPLSTMAPFISQSLASLMPRTNPESLT